MLTMEGCTGARVFHRVLCRQEGLSERPVWQECLGPGGWELGTAREVARTRPTAGTRPKSTATKGFEFYSQSFENPRIITRL